MDRQLRQMTRLIDDLMDVSRIARGRIQLEKGPVDLGAGEARRRGDRADDADRGQLLHVDVPSDPLPIEGDEVRLMQVLLNLLNNAAKYTGRGGTIWATARRDRDHAVVSVRDNGPGIPRKTYRGLRHVFAVGIDD